MRDAVGVHIAHRDLDFFEEDLRIPLGDESDGLLLVAEALQDDIQMPAFIKLPLMCSSSSRCWNT